MRILLVTNQSDHHKYWAHSLYSKYDVVGICNPKSKPNRGILARDLKERGFLFLMLKLLSAIYHKLSGNSFTKRLSRLQSTYYSEQAKEFDSIPKELIYSVDDVNSRESIRKAEELAPDVICFLGGDIVKKKFLSVAKITTLNYHSGVSPFYNGSGTTHSAVADARPNFCGGTIMTMNERIDGGDILAHYLTPIEANDNSSSLFLKGIEGAVKLYSLVLDQIIQNSTSPAGFGQGRSVRYCTSSDWTIYQDLKLSQFERSGKMKRYARVERVFSYLNVQSDPQQPPYLETLAEILRK